MWSLCGRQGSYMSCCGRWYLCVVAKAFEHVQNTSATKLFKVWSWYARSAVEVWSLWSRCGLSKVSVLEVWSLCIFIDIGWGYTWCMLVACSKCTRRSRCVVYTGWQYTRSMIAVYSFCSCRTLCAIVIGWQCTRCKVEVYSLCTRRTLCEVSLPWDGLAFFVSKMYWDSCDLCSSVTAKYFSHHDYSSTSATKHIYHLPL